MTLSSRNLFKDTQGNVAPIFAIAIIPIFMSAGAAIDYSRMSSDMTRMQNAIDSALLAGGHDLLNATGRGFKKRGITKKIHKYLEANIDPKLYAQIKSVRIKYDRSDKSLTATLRAATPTTLLHVMGKKKLDYTVVASTQAENNRIEVVLVLDNTGSMLDDSKLDDLKAASSSFVDQMLDLNKRRPTAQIGIVPFSEYVNVGSTKARAKWVKFSRDANKKSWNGCVGSRNAPHNLTDDARGKPFPAVNSMYCPLKITSLTNNKSKLNSSISSMVANGGTYIPGGLMWGWRVISSGAPFNKAVSYGTARKQNIRKVILLMTDGENTISPNIPASPYHNNLDVDYANNATSQACSNIKGNNITLYTMSFGTSITPETKTLMKNCASGPGKYFHAASGGDLSAAFNQVSSDLKKLRLTR